MDLKKNISKDILIHGFTMIEVLIVAAVLGIVASVVIPKFGEIKNTQVVKSAVSDVIGAIDDARSKSFASMQNTEWSVHFETTKIVIYKGTGAYNSSIINAPECNAWAGQNPCKITTTLVNSANITDISLSGGGSELYFNRLDSTPNKTGTVTLTVGDESKILTIGPTGTVSVADVIPSTYNFTVNMAGSYGSSTVTSSPAGINCNADCTESYSTGTSITLTANAVSGHTFTGWSGDCTGSGTCVINNISANKNVTATFTAVPRTVTAIISGSYGSSTVTSSPAGINCNADCTESYDNGTTITLTANPASGYTFSGWSGTSSGECSGSTCTFNSIGADKAVTANFITTPTLRTVTVTMGGSYGSSTVTSSPVGINCISDCAESYNDGTNITLTANPASGYTFSGWSGTSSGECSGSTCTFNSIGADKAVTATFAVIPIVRTLNITMGGTYGSSTVISNSPTSSGIACSGDCTENYNDTTPVTLTANPVSGYTFSGWSNGNNTCTGTTNPCILNMTSNITLTATFAVTRTLNINSSNGSVSGTGISCGIDCTEIYTNGTNVALTATPNSGYVFSSWVGGNNTCTGSTNPCSLNMTSDLTVTANFTLIPLRTVTVTMAGSYGSSTVTSSPAGINCNADCTESYDNGTTITLTANPASGYTFSGWSGTSSGECSGSTCTFNSIGADKAVTATFAVAPTTRALTVTMAGNYGTSTVTSTGISCVGDCTESVSNNTQVTLTANLASGFGFTSWSGVTCNSGATTNPCVFTITADTNVTATFNGYPQVQSTNTSTSPDGTENHTVNLPTGIVSGDLVLVFFALDNSSNTVTWPSGWTRLSTGAVGSNKLEIGYKVFASSCSDPCTISVATGAGNGQPSAHQSIRIGTGSYNTTTPIQASSVASGSSTTPDTANFDPSGWGTVKTLWFSVTSRNSGSSRPTSAYPASYTNGVTVHVAPTNTNGATLSTARRENTVSAENPGSFTITGGSDSWLGFTVGIQGL